MLDIEKLIVKIPDYPKPGILFYDISKLLNESNSFKETIRLLKEKIVNYKFDKIAAIDARGFIFGSALANELDLGLTIIRKKNKVPGKKISYEYNLEYGKDSLEINPEYGESNFILVDDVLATGGTANAACKLIEKSGGNISCFLTLIELDFLNGRNKINVPCESLINY